MRGNALDPSMPKCTHRSRRDRAKGGFGQPVNRKASRHGVLKTLLRNRTCLSQTGAILNKVWAHLLGTDLMTSQPHALAVSMRRGCYAASWRTELASPQMCCLQSTSVRSTQFLQWFLGGGGAHGGAPRNTPPRFSFVKTGTFSISEPK